VGKFQKTSDPLQEMICGVIFEFLQNERFTCKVLFVSATKLHGGKTHRTTPGGTSDGGNPITLANRVLTDSFFRSKYKKSDDSNKFYIHDIFIRNMGFG